MKVMIVFCFVIIISTTLLVIYNATWDDEHPLKRYNGDDNDDDDKKTKDHSQDHLTDLLKKIEERKKLREKKTAKKPQINDTSIINKNIENLSLKNDKIKSTIDDDNVVDDDTKKLCLENDSSDNKLTENNNNNNNNDNKINNNQDFMILGAAHNKKKQIVKRVLPKWLAKPEIISVNLSTGCLLDNFENKLDIKLINTLKLNGIDKLFPVQESLINWMNKCKNDRKMGYWPRHTCVSAPTGSGKTLAYVLPVIDQLQEKFIREIRCLVVLPVKELASQVFKVMQTYAAPSDLRVGLICGTVSFENEQMNLVKKTQNGDYISRVDIVIATPGRLIDHIEKTQGFTLLNLEFLIIDEADRTTEWLKYIPEPHRSPPIFNIKNIKSCKIPPAQKLLFSATLSQDPEKLSRLGLFQPILFTSVVINDRDEDINLDKEVGNFIGRYTSPQELTERAVQCEAEYKPVALVKLITSTSQNKIDKTLVFTNSGESAHRLAILVGLLLSKNNIIVDELSAKLSPKQRTEVLKKFTNGQIQVLISSDALARGVDIAGVKLVVSYDLPKHIKGYIHRAGRTGRAGLPGTAISILTSNQVNAYTQMLTSAHKAFPAVEQIQSLDTYAESIDYQMHVEKLKDIIENQAIKEADKIKSSKRKHSARN